MLCRKEKKNRRGKMKKSLLLGALICLSACTSITVDDYNAVKKGMSIGEVQQRLGEWYWNQSCKQDTSPENEAAGVEKYYCNGDNGFRSYTIGFTFKDGVLIRKYNNGRLD